MKRCNKCLIEKELSQFDSDNRNKDGLQGRCITCRKEEKYLRRQEKIAAGSPVTVETKRCNKCENTKLAVDFFKDAGIADGLATICKECKQQTNYKWREKKKEEYNAYMRQYRKTHPEKYNQARNRGLKHRYGIDQMEYNRLLVAQEGRCGICKLIPDKRPLVVDHSHLTKEVRGLLCDGCNVIIAIFDDPTKLAQAKTYLKIP